MVLGVRIGRQESNCLPNSKPFECWTGCEDYLPTNTPYFSPTNFLHKWFFSWVYSSISLILNSLWVHYLNSVVWSLSFVTYSFRYLFSLYRKFCSTLFCWYVLVWISCFFKWAKVLSYLEKKCCLFFGRWGRVSVIYSLGLGLKDPALVRFHVIKKEMRFKKLYIRKYAEMKKWKKAKPNTQSRVRSGIGYRDNAEGTLEGPPTQVHLHKNLMIEAHCLCTSQHPPIYLSWALVYHQSLLPVWLLRKGWKIEKENQVLDFMVNNTLILLTYGVFSISPIAWCGASGGKGKQEFWRHRKLYTWS